MRVTIESIYLQNNAKHKTLTNDEPFFVIVFVFVFCCCCCFFMSVFFFCFVLFLFFAMKKRNV